MKNCMKMVYGLVLLAAIASLAFGAGAVKAADPVRISFMIWDEVQRPIFDEIVAKFMEANQMQGCHRGVVHSPKFQ